MLKMARALAVAGTVLLTAAAGAPSAAQVPATNDVAACTLLADPTAQRSCIESARQKRPATSFDPSAARPRGSRNRGQDGDVTGLGRAADARRSSSPRDAHRAKRAEPAGTAPEQPVQIP